jgi:hypothetical protein
LKNNIDFIQQFNELILVREKSEKSSLVYIYDIITGSQSMIEDFNPDNFLFLYHINRILIFQNGKITSYSDPFKSSLMYIKILIKGLMIILYQREV